MVIQHGRVQQQMSQELTEIVEATNRRLQRAVAAQSPRGRLIVTEESGHNIPFELPELVLAAIREVVEAARMSAPGRLSSKAPVHAAAS